MNTRDKMESFYLPAEWYEQSGVQLTWPHAATDWSDMLDEVDACFLSIAKAIVKYEPVLVVTPEPERVKSLMQQEMSLEEVTFAQLPTNDTWARDHGALTCVNGYTCRLLDFGFNGWGLKFASNYDNQITHGLVQQGFLKGAYVDVRDFIFEGGSIESDGEGTLLTTEACLCSENRNPTRSKDDIEAYLKQKLGACRVLWLSYGYLAGDDTDSHIDTLARLCPQQTIAYVQCTDPDDEHFESLQLMENQLKTFKTVQGKPYRLVALPMVPSIWFEGERLPATYANFLVLNSAVLVPTYACSTDEIALQRIQEVFPSYSIVGIDCRALIKQHGSLHCVTMQYPKGVLS